MEGGFTIKNLYLTMIALLALFVVGCGGDVNSNAQDLADPTNQLTPHVNWNSYNLYRYEPGTTGTWTKIVALGQLQGTLPALGTNPVLLTHGYGGSIRNNKLIPLAQDLIGNGLASIVLGFEYDSQDSIVNNGGFYTQALQLLNPNGSPTLTWAFISHSMGGLVVRSAVLGSTLPIATTGNRLITLGTPHLGSPVANAAQDSQDVPTRAAIITELSQGGFVNADGNPCQVSLDAQGFTDLRTDSAFLSSLNGNIGVHPQINTFTIAGTQTGEYQAINDLLKVTTDDGMVTITSANPSALNSLGTGTAPVDHTQLTIDTATTFPLIRAFLVQ